MNLLLTSFEVSGSNFVWLHAKPGEGEKELKKMLKNQTAFVNLIAWNAFSFQQWQKLLCSHWLEAITCKLWEVTSHELCLLCVWLLIATKPCVVYQKCDAYILVPRITRRRLFSKSAFNQAVSTLISINFYWLNIPRTHTYVLSSLFGLLFGFSPFFISFSLQEGLRSSCPFRCSNREGNFGFPPSCEVCKIHQSTTRILPHRLVGTCWSYCVQSHCWISQPGCAPWDSS